MNQYIARANVDHYLSMLNGSDLSPDKRATVTKLLIEEEDKLGHDLEQLEFAEARVAKARDKVDRLKALRDAFAEGSQDRARADAMLATFEALHKVMDQFCDHMRSQVSSRRL